MPVDTVQKFGDWFVQTFGEKLGRRSSGFQMALSWMIENGGKNIVETGCLRTRDNWAGDGYSTLIFGEAAKWFDLYLWTVDIDPGNLATAQAVTEHLKSRIIYTLGDSISFLDQFESSIDLLYLDSLDSNIDTEVAQLHQVQELEAAHSKLSGRSAVLLDDNFDSGKTKRTNKTLKNLGWRQLLDDYQALWVR